MVHWDGTSWSLSTSGNGAALFGMAATSSSDVWAVGYESSGTLVMHWDGTTWSPVNSPRPFPYAGELWSVSAISPTEVWATGDASAGQQDTSLTIRYTQWCPTPVQCATGWNVIDVSNPSPDVNFFSGIDGVSADDIWGVGAFALTNGGTYVQHWNGSYWLPVSIPGVPAVTVLRSVKALSSNDVWAVGTAYDSTLNKESYSAIAPDSHKPGQSRGSQSLNFHTMIVHWDGTSWTRVPSPNPGTLQGGNQLFGISGVSASDLWAVGFYVDNNGYETLILHWNGSTWSQVASPAGDLAGVTAISSNDVWAVGENSGYTATLILHWDGTQWSTMASPNPGTGENELQAISDVVSNDIWAVGGYSNSGGYHALTIHWDGSQWTAVSAPGVAVLKAVSARASNDVWAVGISEDSNQAPVMHWDGTAWTIVSHPPPGPDPDDISELYGVLALVLKRSVGGWRRGPLLSPGTRRALRRLVRDTLTYGHADANTRCKRNPYVYLHNRVERSGQPQSSLNPGQYFG